jgi:hypothetical protein
MPSAVLSRRVEKVVGYPPLSEMSVQVVAAGICGRAPMSSGALVDPYR